ncbi:hypothetical protein DFQ02_105150 [Seonamhaeicola aphaedonensis]|uniref:Uncharacterized protein n=1 Tax=Seonamhaeicola aphaedonensis TaxID=1461338 RepID=A0A3D9HEM4_9FLAO|nr:hypothetical protein DFQ02_105150 [Seonamhaeicola aphaedonensis]
MIEKILKVHKETKLADFEIWHFLIRFTMFFGLSISILIMTIFIFLMFYSGFWTGTLSKTENALIVFFTYTIDLTIILFILKSRYKFLRKQMNFTKCKSYLWIGIMFIFIYMALMPITIESF